MAKKTQEQKDADAARKLAEDKAKKARADRNSASIDRRNAIADAADAEREKTEPLTAIDEEEDPVDDAGDPDPHENEEGDAESIAQAQAEEDENDEAREAGAEDTRKSASGVTEYRLTVNGKAKWATLEQIRASAQKVDSADEYLQNASEAVTRAAAKGPTADEVQAEQQEESDRKGRVAHLKDLQTRAALGDDEAIDELAQVLDGLSRVTPDVLRIVDQRVDARVAGTNAFQGAVDWFEGEYATELSSPRLKKFAAQLDKQFASESPGMPPKERLKKVGEELREMRKEFGGKTPGPSTKQLRKEEVGQVPRASGRRVESDDEEPVETIQETIRRMAQGRQGRTVTR
jgi:hypothetical protein